MIYSVRQAALEELLNKMAARASINILCLQHSVIDKTPTFFAMGHQTALLHLTKHRGDGRIGEPTLRKGTIDGGYRSRTACPQFLKNPQLQVSDHRGIRFSPHNYRCNTTLVVVLSMEMFSLSLARFT